MKILRVLWGLLVDDARLGFILVVSLVIGDVVARAGFQTVAALVIWAGLVGSLWVSVNHQLRLKLRK